MRKNRNGVLIAAAALCVFVLAGCQTGSSGTGGSDEDVLRVAWWGGQERHTMTIEMIELFEDKYPDIQVEPEYTAWDNYWERLTTQAAGSNLPDIVQMDNSKLNEYISRNLVKDLTPFIEEGSIDLTHVNDAYQDMNTIDDAVYAISLGSNALGMIYNQQLFDEHGVQLEEGYTYEDLKDKMRTLGEAVGDEFYGYDLISEFEMFSVFARQNGETVFNEDGDGLGFSDEHLIAFFQFLTEMLDEGLSPPHEITLEYVEGGDSPIADGLTGMGLIASNQIIGQQALTEEELSLSPLPALVDGVEGNWIRPSMSFSVTEHTDQAENAALFIDFVTNDPEANEILQAERGVPISSEIRAHLEGKVSEEVEKTFEYLEYMAENAAPADPLPPPGESEVRGSFIRIVEAVKYGQTSPEEAAAQFRSEAEAILN